MTDDERIAIRFRWLTSQDSTQWECPNCHRHEYKYAIDESTGDIIPFTPMCGECGADLGEEGAMDIPLLLFEISRLTAELEVAMFENEALKQRRFAIESNMNRLAAEIEAARPPCWPFSLCKTDIGTMPRLLAYFDTDAERDDFCNWVASKGQPEPSQSGEGG